MTGAERRVVIVGVGNDLRGDDAVGLEVARRLADDPGLEVHVHAREPVELLDVWEGADAVLVVDAVSSGAPPGTLHRVDASREPVPATLRRTSSHLIGVAEVIELGRTLRRLPEVVVLFGIEGTQFGTGAQPGPAVAGAIERTVAALRQEAHARRLR